MFGVIAMYNKVKADEYQVEPPFDLRSNVTDFSVNFHLNVDMFVPVSTWIDISLT